MAVKDKPTWLDHDGKETKVSGDYGYLHDKSVERTDFLIPNSSKPGYHDHISVDTKSNLKNWGTHKDK